MKKLMTIWMLSLVAGLTSCKDESEKTLTGFNINEPVGYFIYAKYNISGSGNPVKTLLEFKADNKLRLYTTELPINQVVLVPYEIVDDYTIKVDRKSDKLFMFSKDSITSTIPSYTHLKLLKQSGKNELSGKTFTGSYYKANNQVLHPSFFYRFGENEISAGFKTDNVVRKTNYTTIGGIAAISGVPGTQDVELVTLVNQKLETDYWSASNNTHQHAALTEQK